MKLIASSQVPTDPLPYLHLAYGSAASSIARHNRDGAISVTVFLFLLAFSGYMLYRGIRAGKQVLLLALAFACTLLLLGLAVQYHFNGPERHVAGEAKP